MRDLSKRLREELETFFMTAAKLEDKKLDIKGWHEPKHARALLEDGAKRFKKSQS